MFIQKNLKKMLIQKNLKTTAHPKMLENKCSSTERGKGATLTSSTQAFDVIAAHNCPQLSSSSASTYHHCHHHQHQHHYQHIAVLYFLVIWVWKSIINKQCSVPMNNNKNCPVGLSDRFVTEQQWQ